MAQSVNEKRINNAKKLRKLISYLPEQTPETTEILWYLEKYEGQVADRAEASELQDWSDYAIWICGYPALTGTMLLERYHKEELYTYFPERFFWHQKEWEAMRKEADVLQGQWKEFQVQFPDTCIQMYPLGEGGMRKAIYQLGKESGCGFRIQYEQVPVKQECIEVCEFFNLDPWELASWGTFLVVAPRDVSLQKILGSTLLPCRRIGRLTQAKEKLICSKAGESGINRPGPDGLLRVLQRRSCSDTFRRVL